VTGPPGRPPHDPLAWDAFLRLYRACERALRERCAPSVPRWPDRSALAEAAARGLIMYEAWG
jgi:hypothetical protein